MKNIFYLDQSVQQLIDQQVLVPEDKEHLVEPSINAANNLTKRMLDCTIEIRSKKFILTNLELYYGGIGDMAHDWYRVNFSDKYEIKSRGISTENTNFKRGF